ncbi:hypothetical protein ABZ234_08110 [Nocardiopsis sp. NPDC006198]|uniref:hypothetical protein n=1 Tax=Nocardiopsis sp. NPDC006198 TaxID=3154472 RepID=UPI0033A90956
MNPPLLDQEGALELCQAASPHAGNIDVLLFLAVAEDGTILHHGTYDEVQPHTTGESTLMGVAATDDEDPESHLIEVWAPIPFHIPGIITPIPALVEITDRTGLLLPGLTLGKPDLPLWDRFGLLEYRDQIAAHNARATPEQQVPLDLSVYREGSGYQDADIATVTHDDLRTTTHSITTSPELRTISKNLVGPVFFENVLYSLPPVPGTRWEIAD